MKTFAAVVLLFLSFTASAQVVVEGTDINTLPGVEYISVCFVTWGGGQIVAVDYGVASKSGKHVEGDDGKPRKFNTDMEALNYMYSHGWEYVDQRTISGGLTWFILRRKSAQ